MVTVIVEMVVMAVVVVAVVVVTVAVVTVVEVVVVTTERGVRHTQRWGGDGGGDKQPSPIRIAR